MDESEAVLERLRRIEALDRADAGPGELVGELRALLSEAEAWSRREGGDVGARAVRDLRGALDGPHDENVLAHAPETKDP